MFYLILRKLVTGYNTVCSGCGPSHEAELSIGAGCVVEMPRSGGLCQQLAEGRTERVLSISRQTRSECNAVKTGTLKQRVFSLVARERFKNADILL